MKVISIASLGRAVGLAVGIAAALPTAAHAVPTASFGIGGQFTIETGTTLGNNTQIHFVPPAPGINTSVTAPGTTDLAGAVKFGDLGALLDIADIGNIG